MLAIRFRHGGVADLLDPIIETQGLRAARSSGKDWRPKMDSETLKATEAYSADRATAPRVSLGDMEGKIARELYFTAGEAELAIFKTAQSHNPLDLLTICILVMQNGFTIIGKSAPVSPENFDIEKGKRFAYEDAIKQLWPLEGYALRDRLAAA